MLTSNWAVSLPIGPSFDHTLYGMGAIEGVGAIGKVQALPVTVFGQYRFCQPTDTWRPYVMLGLSYVKFFDARGSTALDAINPMNPVDGHTTFDVASRFGASPGAGISMAINEHWMIDVYVVKTLLNTTTTLSTGQKIDTRLNPLVTAISVGVRF
jgi:outer membrane protein